MRILPFVERECQERAVAHLAFPVTETRCMQAYGWKCTKTSSNNHFSFREHSGGHEALFAAPAGQAVALCSEPRNHIAQQVAPPSVPMAPIDAAARAVANSSQTPTGDASKSTGKRKTMEQQTELSTTCPVCKHTAGHNGESIVTPPCCKKQLYCRACVTDLITKGCKLCLGCTNKLQPLRDFKPFRVSEIESPAVRAIVQDHFDISHRCDMTTAPTPAAAALAPHRKQIVAALMQKLKDKHFPALPDCEIPTRKVIPLPGQRHPGTLISSPSQPRPLTPRPLTPRPLRSHTHPSSTLTLRSTCGGDMRPLHP